MRNMGKKMNLSIVTGTYNRLPFLQSFMTSCRSQIPRGISYEFCICDGGATDGTLGWLKEQSDVVLLEHGELRGAIKAFNDAAKLATGDFLLIANDDIEILPGSIMRGLSYMINYTQVGAGCFYQDRAGLGTHVEVMTTRNEDGTPGSTPYLQVGLIPRFLWEYCGGWGDFGARAYGGGN